MVFYNKKEVTLEYTPMRLERRHTMAEGGPDMDKSRTSRTSSVSGLGGRTNSIAQVEQAPKPRTPLTEDRRNTFSTASVVITESELTSSWLYNSQKAHVNANTGISPASKCQMTSSSLENLIPEERPDPCMKSTPASMELPTVRRTSCWCYVMIASVIFLASLGILAAIGGIVYMELLAGQEVKYNQSTGSQDNTNDIQKLANEHESEGKLDEPLLSLDVPKIELFEKISPVATDDSLTDALFNEDTSSFQRKFDDESKVKMIEDTNNTISSTDPKQSDNNNQTLDLSNSFEIGKSNSSDMPLPETVTTEMPDSDKGELFVESENWLHQRILTDGNQNTNLTADTNFQHLQEPEENGFNELILINTSSSNIGNNVEEILDSEEDNPDSDQLQSKFNNQDPSDYLETEKIPVELNVSLLPSLDSTTESILLLNTEHQRLEALNDTTGQNDVADKITDSTGENELLSDSDFDRLTPMNRTVNDTNALPLEFFQRLGFNQDYIVNHPALSVEDMNVKFSLAEALKYLRSLDVNSKHPTERRKSTPPQDNGSRSGRKLNVDNKGERQAYLQKLRRKIFH